MHKLPSRTSAALDALLDERDHLQVQISLAADDPTAHSEKLVALSKRLGEVECQIAAEHRKMRPGIFQGRLGG
jgi:hypothetical protein